MLNNFFTNTKTKIVHVSFNGQMNTQACNIQRYDVFSTYWEITLKLWKHRLILSSIMVSPAFVLEILQERRVCACLKEGEKLIIYRYYIHFYSKNVINTLLKHIIWKIQMMNYTYMQMWYYAQIKT